MPARSPHWGGVYERLIRVTKSTLKKVLGRSLISLAELSTPIKEIQAVLNDRPLTAINSDINDLQPLLIIFYSDSMLPRYHILASIPSNTTRASVITRILRAHSINVPPYMTIFANVSQPNIYRFSVKHTLTKAVEISRPRIESKMATLF